MEEFTTAQLEAAQKAFSSSIRKIEKVRETLLKKEPLPKSQLTLSARNLDALRLAMVLIARELDKGAPQSSEALPL